MISSRIQLFPDNSKDIYYPISTKEIVRTEQIWISDEEFISILSELCHISKNLWNYVIRQLFTQKDKDGNRIGQYMKYSDLDYLIKDKSENYRKLNGATSQQILKILDRSWKSFFEAIKDWVKNPDKYLGRPRLPGYKAKDGEFLLIFTNQQCKIKDGYLKFPKKLKELKIKTRLDDETLISRKTGPAIQILTLGRNIKVKDVMHKYSRFIIDYCIKHNIGTIVIGHNPGQKQEINLGTKINQNFVQIPEYLFRKMIKYKGEDIGIDVKEQEESHTSKCSFLDDEPIGHSGRYMGKRIYNATCHGGLFRSSYSQLCKGKIINADVQGAYNIIKKAIPKAFMNLKVIRTDGIEGVGLHPIRINPLIVNRNVNIIGD